MIVAIKGTTDEASTDKSLVSFWQSFVCGMFKQKNNP